MTAENGASADDCESAGCDRNVHAKEPTNTVLRHQKLNRRSSPRKNFFSHFHLSEIQRKFTAIAARGWLRTAMSDICSRSGYCSSSFALRSPGAICCTFTRAGG